MRRLLVAGAVLALSALSASAEQTAVTYPEGYRDWRHVKTMVINEGHPLFESFGGIHHLYANRKALEGYAAGRFPDGAVIVFDLLAARATADHAIVEGERKVLGVMVKDAARFAGTGGWGFEGFAAGDPARPVVGDEAGEACFACHTEVASRDYVFSRPRP